MEKSINIYLKNKKYKSFTVNNPIDENFWSPLKKVKFSKKFKLDKKKINIGISNIDEKNFDRKGLDIFLSVIDKLKKNNTKFRIIEFGNKNSNFIPNSVDSFKFGSTKSDKKIKYIYNSMDLLILPSKLEAFGQVASEAILCGTPVIGFKDTGLEDIILHKKMAG